MQCLVEVNVRDVPVKRRSPFLIDTPRRVESLFGVLGAARV